MCNGNDVPLLNRIDVDVRDFVELNKNVVDFDDHHSRTADT